ncbi:hypothetical protein [Bradyrhizobium sp. 150]|uniref:hypothetical protein n=1 Tax=Bradyrhizobium sp. 150 TaxID=2782625 RepID=UPI001FFABB4E|nr:hypothetical protein [Bradyrhizobium sp. 150]MCK1670342.1 hypothetical protein [Bradyrhizobium sp. 150]
MTRHFVDRRGMTADTMTADDLSKLADEIEAECESRDNDAVEFSEEQTADYRLAAAIVRKYVETLNRSSLK